MKQYFSIYALLLIGIFLVITSSCEKDEDPIPSVTVSTISVTNISANSAQSSSSITNDGGKPVTTHGVVYSTNQKPTVENNEGIINDGTELASFTSYFTSYITDLEPNTTYYLRAYATNSDGTGYGDAMSFSTREGNTFTDPRDGNVYQTVTIGDQEWMAENLKYLPSVVGPDTASETTHYYVYRYNGTNVADAKATANYNTYGVLYNWPAAMNACPAGWHLSSDAEWTELTDYLGGKSDSAPLHSSDYTGRKLKEIGTSHWFLHQRGTTNETGFAALPGGFRSGGSFSDLRYYGFWWSATEIYSPNDNAWCRSMMDRSSTVYGGIRNKRDGYSVRCIKD
jgi:uncharacterized protein (TIGR02145 family)